VDLKAYFKETQLVKSELLKTEVEEGESKEDLTVSHQMHS